MQHEQPRRLVAPPWDADADDVAQLLKEPAVDLDLRLLGVDHARGLAALDRSLGRRVDAAEGRRVGRALPEHTRTQLVLELRHLRAVPVLDVHGHRGHRTQREPAPRRMQHRREKVRAVVSHGRSETDRVRRVRRVRATKAGDVRGSATV
ncbi:hypothetical protein CAUPRSCDRAFT_12845 [Caulochytrium protostelioides]|uniref:Uncharacterized protein n=1 Tax=Caulochytrium protostelioides TaxID=1555241 RepID=A0A4P9WSS8_9FUNG|nr:hypothetical protein CAUPRSCDRAFT_12845 [Caulochytrium protostelioides]